eukprot:4947003-Amphidinium_carterae.2
MILGVENVCVNAASLLISLPAGMQQLEESLPIYVIPARSEEVLSKDSPNPNENDYELTLPAKMF